MEETTKRLLNSKQRSIGIDKEFLDLQIREKKHREIQEQKDAEIEANHMRETLEYLEEQERIKESNRLQRIEEYQRTLENQIEQPKNNAIRKCDPVNLETCGSSSLQRFAGEDVNYKERVKSQQEQLTRWCLKALKEKEVISELEECIEREYTKQVQEEDIFRGRLERERKRQNLNQDVKVKGENKKIAEERKMRMVEMQLAEKALEEMESHHVSTSPLYTEIISPKRIGPTDFKGFDKEEVSFIIRSNEALLSEKMKMKDADIQREKEWVSQQHYMARQMEEMELARKKAIEEDNRIQLEILNAQRKDFDKKKGEMRKDRFGEIGNGFFQKFGTALI